MHRRSGRKVFSGRASWSAGRIREFAGRITRSNRTTAAGMERRRITITTGTTAFTPAAALAGRIPPHLAMIAATAPTPSARSVGDDGAGNQIGMAPQAKFIGCRNMNVGVGSPATYTECFEWFLAPYPIGGTPADGDPSKAPDITTNSWTCPASEGCSPTTLQAGVEAQRAAGIMMVVAAGNSGPSCSTVSDPPALYDASYTVGCSKYQHRHDRFLQQPRAGHFRWQHAFEAGHHCAGHQHAVVLQHFRYLLCAPEWHLDGHTACRRRGRPVVVGSSGAAERRHCFRKRDQQHRGSHPLQYLRRWHTRDAE